MGDFGLGFKWSEESDKFWLEVFKSGKNKAPYSFIRGNHDSPAYVSGIDTWTPDGVFRDGTFYCGGAYSIDKGLRTQDVDWWADEELSIKQLNVVVDDYMNARPDRVVTHTCPWFIADLLFNDHGKMNGEYGNRTEQAFDAMFTYHQPKEWIFGHWHESKDEVINGTRFICLRELETIQLEKISDE